MNTEVFTKFGMTPVEAQVYSSILGLKDTPMGHIIKKTGLHRGTVYNSLINLIRKGFVSFIDKTGLRYYNASDSRVFESIIEEQKKELEEHKKTVDKILSDFKCGQEGLGPQEVGVYNGVASFKSLFLEMYEFCKNGKIEYLFQGKGGEMEEAVGEAFYKYTKKLRAESKIKCRMILDSKYSKIDEKESSIVKKRFVSNKVNSPVNYWIYGDNILMVLFEIEPLTIIKIRSANLAASMRDYFEHLWKSAMSFQDRKTYSSRLVNMVQNSKGIDILCKTITPPFFIYPHKEKEFLKYRAAREKRRTTLTGKNDIDIFRAYKNMWDKGYPVRYVIGEDSMNYFFNIALNDFGKGECLKRIADIRKNLKKYKVDIRILYEYNPITMYLTEKDFLIVMPATGEVYGFATSEEQVMETFRKMYEAYWDRSKPVEEYLKQLEEKIKNNTKI